MSRIDEALYRISGVALQEDIDTSRGYWNSIKKDLINGAKGTWGDGLNLITSQSEKCSHSVMNNVMYLLKRDKPCSLCLGSFRLPADDPSLQYNYTGSIAHVWVEYTDEEGNKVIIQTQVDPKAVGNNEAFRITFEPSDLDSLVSILNDNL